MSTQTRRYVRAAFGANHGALPVVRGRGHPAVPLWCVAVRTAALRSRTDRSGSHYSNAGIVLFYLMRLEPFASLHIELQGGKFDYPDRLFTSLAQTWQNCLASVSTFKGAWHVHSCRACCICASCRADP